MFENTVVKILMRSIKQHRYPQPLGDISWVRKVIKTRDYAFDVEWVILEHASLRHVDSGRSSD